MKTYVTTLLTDIGNLSDFMQQRCLYIDGKELLLIRSVCKNNGLMDITKADNSASDMTVGSHKSRSMFDVRVSETNTNVHKKRFSCKSRNDTVNYDDVDKAGSRNENRHLQHSRVQPPYVYEIR